MNSPRKAIGGVLAVACVASSIAWMIFMRGGGSLVVREYRKQGFKMVDGCNGGAANAASGSVHILKQLLEIFADSSQVATNAIVRLNNALLIAQEMERVLRNDCASRGHCETFPWRTNWAIVEEAITTAYKFSEEMDHGPSRLHRTPR